MHPVGNSSVAWEKKEFIYLYLYLLTYRIKISLLFMVLPRPMLVKVFGTCRQIALQKQSTFPLVQGLILSFGPGSKFGVLSRLICISLVNLCVLRTLIVGWIFKFVCESELHFSEDISWQILKISNEKIITLLLNYLRR